MKKSRISSDWSKLFQNTSYSMYSKAIIVVISITIEAMIARLLTVDEYGEWCFFFSIITIVYSIAWLGINVTSKIFVSKYDKKEQMTDCIRVSFSIRIVASIVFSIVYYLILYFVVRYCFSETFLKYPHLSKLLFLGGALVFLNSLIEYYKEISIGTVSFRNLLFLAIAEYGGYFVLGYVGIWIWGGNIGLIGGYVFGALCAVIYGRQAINRYCGKKIKPTSNMGKLGREILKYSFYICFSSIAVKMLVEVDVAMLGYIGTGKDTALYSIAKQLCGKASNINVALSDSTMTLFSVLTMENIQEKKKKLWYVIFLNAFVSIAIVLGFAGLGRVAIAIIYGKQYSNAYLILVMLLPYYFMDSVSKCFVLFLDYQKYAKVRSKFCVLTVILDVIMNFLMIPKYGAKGVAFATTVSLIPYVVFLVVMTMKIIKQYERKE